MRSKTHACDLIVLLLSIGLTSVALAQTGWWRTYGGTGNDDGRSVQQTADGGYVVAGRTRSFGAEYDDVYLIKTNASGDTLWTRTYGGTDGDVGYSVQQTSDGGYIIAGATCSFGAGTPDYRNVYLIKTNVSGDSLWTGTYGGTGSDESYSVQQTADGGYIIAGYTWSFGAGFTDIYLVKTNASGDTLWTRTYGGWATDEGYSVQQTADGGYVVAGGTYSLGAGNDDVYLVRTNAQGDTLWTRTYGGTYQDEGYSVQQTSDGGYVIAGVVMYFGAGGDVYLIKTDASGDTLWTRTYGGPDTDYGRSVQQTSDGGYVIAGWTLSFGAEGGDAYLIKTDASGDILWTRTYGGTGWDEANSVQQTADGGYIIAGSTTSFGSGSYDVFLIKTDSLGSVGVAEENPKPRVMRGRIGPTVLSGTSGVRQLASCVAFDAMGRRVLNAKPGVYFMKNEAAASQKVLLVR